MEPRVFEFGKAQQPGENLLHLSPSLHHSKTHHSVFSASLLRRLQSFRQVDLGVGDAFWKDDFPGPGL